MVRTFKHMDCICGKGTATERTYRTITQGLSMFGNLCCETKFQEPRHAQNNLDLIFFGEKKGNLRKLRWWWNSRPVFWLKSSTPLVKGLPSWLGWWRIRLLCGRPGLNPWVGKIPWRRERLHTPVFLPGELHGQRRLARYIVKGRRLSNTTEPLRLSFFFWSILFWHSPLARLSATSLFLIPTHHPHCSLAGF